MQSFPATMLTLVGLFAAASVIRPRSPSAPATGKTAKAAQPDAPMPISNAKSSRRGASPKVSRPAPTQGGAALPRRSAPDAAALGSKQSTPPGLRGQRAKTRREQLQ